MTSLRFTEWSMGEGVLYNLVFTEWRHCVSQNIIASIFRLHGGSMSYNGGGGWINILNKYISTSNFGYPENTSQRTMTLLLLSLLIKIHSTNVYHAVLINNSCIYSYLKKIVRPSVGPISDKQWRGILFCNNQIINVDLMLAQSRRWWANNKSTLAQCLLLAGYDST